MDGEQLFAALLLSFFGALVVSWLVQLLVGWSAYNAILPIPAEHREIEPVLAFGLFVPFMGTLMGFLVQPALSRSYKRWFAARGLSGARDCGEGLAGWNAIAGVLAWVPCLPLAGLATIVLQVMYLVRLRRLRRMALALGA